MLFEILGLVFSIIVGTIGHFLYQWSNNNTFIGFLFSKDESIFQHLKLGITPIFMWTIIEFFTYNFSMLFFAKFVSILSFVFTLLFLYYGYKFIMKKNILFLDILIFYISLTVSYIVSIKLLMSSCSGFLLNFIGFMGFVFIGYLYKKLN